MTAEEKAALLKAMNVTVNGDLVIEKHVEHEIGNVEAGGIGIQIVNGGRTAPKKDGRKKASGEARITDAVFTYTFLDDEEGHLRIARLYQLLDNAGWIAKDTKPDVFGALFMGEAKSFTIKWIGSQQDLYYLIKRLSTRKLIKCPKGATKWVITGSHFVDSQSRRFTDWNRQHDPKVSALTIENLCNVLDITKPLDRRRNA